MADQLNGIGARKPIFAAKPEHVPKTRGNEQKADKKLLGGDDRVSLDQADKTQQTYGPIPGVDIGTPYQLLRSLVIKTLSDQGIELLINAGGEILDLHQLTPEKAQELISADGYFGVEQTSERIVDFAINAFGNDPANLEEMRAAIEDGFQQAADAFGGSLPEISHQTYDAVMEKLDAFVNPAER